MRKLFLSGIQVITRSYELPNVDLSSYSSTRHQGQGYYTVENRREYWLYKIALSGVQRKNLFLGFSISFPRWPRLLWLKSNKSHGPGFTILTILLYRLKCHFHLSETIFYLPFSSNWNHLCYLQETSFKYEGVNMLKLTWIKRISAEMALRVILRLVLWVIRWLITDNQRGYGRSLSWLVVKVIRSC